MTSSKWRLTWGTRLRARALTQLAPSASFMTCSSPRVLRSTLRASPPPISALQLLSIQTLTIWKHLYQICSMWNRPTSKELTLNPSWMTLAENAWDLAHSAILAQRSCKRTDSLSMRHLEPTKFHRSMLSKWNQERLSRPSSPRAPVIEPFLFWRTGRFKMNVKLVFRMSLLRRNRCKYLRVSWKQLKSDIMWSIRVWMNHKHR